MALDGRTPVVVGVGQVTSRSDASASPRTAPAIAWLEGRPHPFELMARAIEAAARDCTGRSLLDRAGSLAVVGGLGWRAANPGLLLAERVGIEPSEHVLSATGGTMPVSLLHRAARLISSGALGVAVVVGGECLYTSDAARAAGVRRRDLGWPVQDESVPGPELWGTDREPATPAEVACGITLPIYAYPLLENAWRGAHGLSIHEHRARLGRLWASFSAVAASNPCAWLTRPLEPEEIAREGPDNRMVAFPYTKLLTANLRVDQAAAFICCSVDEARAAGVPKDRWIFPLAGAEANDHWFLSDRPRLWESPALRSAGRRAFELAGTGPIDVGPIDLYSCFPSVVQMAAAELGMAERLERTEGGGDGLTVTGGLTFAGGPGNNYATHAVAAMVDRLREAPDETGLVTGLGWYATKHAVALLSGRPPLHGGAPYRWDDVQATVDLLPRCTTDPAATGPVTVETYTVVYGRDGAPERAICACRTAEGTRTWATIVGRGELEAAASEELLGREGVVWPAARLTLT